MAIDRSKFFGVLRDTLFKTVLTQPQVDGINAILDYWEKLGLKDKRWLAYILATVYHETAKTMQPVREYSRGKGKPYGEKIKMNGTRYLLPNFIYYGRGHVQLTWYENYRDMGRILGIDLLNNPDKALEMETSIKILFEGMTKAKSNFGDFTGKCLEMYFNDKVDDPKGARRIVNGTDKADLIKGYHTTFLKALA